MKKALALGSFMLLVMGCNQPQPTAQAQDNRSAVNYAPPATPLDEKKVICVSQGGFLVPSGNDFACRLPSGNTVNLWSL